MKREWLPQGGHFLQNIEQSWKNSSLPAETALRISDSAAGGYDARTAARLPGISRSVGGFHEIADALLPCDRDRHSGHGISEVRGEVHSMEFVADVLKGVLDKQGVARCFVAGHSMGDTSPKLLRPVIPKCCRG